MPRLGLWSQKLTAVLTGMSGTALLRGLSVSQNTTAYKNDPAAHLGQCFVSYLFRVTFCPCGQHCYLADFVKSKLRCVGLLADLSQIQIRRLWLQAAS